MVPIADVIVIYNSLKFDIAAPGEGSSGQWLALSVDLELEWLYTMIVGLSEVLKTMDLKASKPVFCVLLNPNVSNKLMNWRFAWHWNVMETARELHDGIGFHGCLKPIQLKKYKDQWHQVHTELCWDLRRTCHISRFLKAREGCDCKPCRLSHHVRWPMYESGSRIEFFPH